VVARIGYDKRPLEVLWLELHLQEADPSKARSDRRLSRF
jgi:hypothetical protein